MKHQFSALPATDFDVSEIAEHDFMLHEFGAIGSTEFLAGRWDVQKLIPRCRDGVSRYLPLDNWHAHPWKALAATGCANTAEVQSNVAYRCFLLGQTSHAFVPTGIETTREGLEKYRGNFNRYPVDSLEWMCTTKHFHGQDSESAATTLTRFQRLVVGSGYSECFLPSDGDTELEPVFIRLDNGDRLLGFAYNAYGR